MVKSLRTTPARGGVLIALLALLSTGCAVHLVGIVAPADNHGTTLTTMEGKPYRLVLGPDSRPMAYLDGHEAEHVPHWMHLKISMPLWIFIRILWE